MSKDVKDVEDKEEVKVVLIDKEYGKKIQKVRLAKGMTQQQFATTLSIPLNIIKDYEAGKGVRNGKVIDKINQWITKNT